MSSGQNLPTYTFASGILCITGVYLGVNQSGSYTSSSYGGFKSSREIELETEVESLKAELKQLREIIES